MWVCFSIPSIPGSAAYGINDIITVFSGTSVPGIAEVNDGTGDADVQMSSSVRFRGKTDLIVHKGKLLGEVTLHMIVFNVVIDYSIWHFHLLWVLIFFRAVPVVDSSELIMV